MPELPDHTNVFSRDFGDMLIAVHEESKGSRAWRGVQEKRSEAFETWLGQIAGDLGRLTLRVNAIESHMADERIEKLAWRVRTDERLHDLEQAVTERASEVDLEVLQARVSERARAETARHPITVARIGFAGLVVAALISAGWFIPTSCSYRSQLRPGMTQTGP